MEKINISNAQRAEILTQALPYIKKYSGKTIVIKYGGNAMVDETLKKQVMEDILLLSLVGIKVVLVHGGGPEVSEVMAKMGKEAVFADGLRVTDQETMEIAQMVLAGKVNKDLVNLLTMHGGRAMGISGIDGRLIEAEKKNDVLGYVGHITKIHIQPVIDLLEHDYIPVISTVAYGKDGHSYNINGDTAAAFIAGALKAERLVMMTDVDGILADKDNPETRIPQMTVSELRELYRAHGVSGGMIPKVRSCVDAIEQGVRRVIVMDGRIPHSILIELFTDEGAGTMVKADPKKNGE